MVCSELFIVYTVKKPEILLKNLKFYNFYQLKKLDINIFKKNIVHLSKMSSGNDVYIDKREAKI